MDDLISRQAAISLVKDACNAVMSECESWYDPEVEDEVYKNIHEVDAILKCNKEMRIALANLPSAEPRKKGKWIQPCDITGFGRCSNCNALWDNSLIENRYFKHCPRCGADMREGEET